ncbi:MAG: glycoside hydrolase family 28 protein [Defluviitaleaceae bacterium]|nr:glycoside hydrolase family 28 protein [Defluviitaleaceae bacterium]
MVDIFMYEEYEPRKYNILEVMPFGFVIELRNNDSYFTKEYEIEINGEIHKSNKNVFSKFGLKPDTEYTIKLFDEQFTIQTKKVDFVINVEDYNNCINTAIYSAPEHSISLIYVPKGIYEVSTIFLRSYVDIYLEKGAVIKQTTDKDKLPILKGYQKSYDHEYVDINASWEGNPLDCFTSVIYGKNVKNMKIYGEGTIDGNGDISGFWENHKMKKNGACVNGKIINAYRPKNVLLLNCENISIIGISSINSASWNIHPLNCYGLEFIDLKIESIDESPNTDGLNPESCKHVQIIGCHFSTGDDCIAIKSGKYYMSRKHYKPTEDVTIRNCFMEKGHGAVVIGSEIACGVYEVTVENCLFQETDRGLRIKTRRGRGEKSIVDKISFENIVMDKVRHGFVINMFYHCDPDGKSDYVKNKNVTEKDEFTPTVKNVKLRNVKATNISGSGIFIYGLPENKVTGVSIEDSSFEFAKERIIECPAMLCDFEMIEPIDFFYENCEVEN